MLSKSTSEPKFLTVEDYAAAIIVNRGNNAAVQTLILQAAQANILQQLEEISTKSKVFEETNSDIIKTAIIKELFDIQKAWFTDCKSADASKTETAEHLNNLSKERKQLILTAKEYDLLPNSEQIDNYQPEHGLFINSDTNKAEREIKEGVKKSIQVCLNQEYENQNSSENPLDSIYVFLAQSNYSAFKEDIKCNICAILSRPTTDEGRQLLVKKLQGINLSVVTNTYRADEDKKPLIINSDFSGTNLSDANLRSSRLGGAQFKSAILKRINFGDAELVEANFTDADLSEANLAGAYLKGADFTGANLSYAKLTGNHLDTRRYATDFDPRQLLIARSLIGIKIEPLT
jgi:uncharacterized protein YjbI with pentapeptide repeats